MPLGMSLCWPCAVFVEGVVKAGVEGCDWECGWGVLWLCWVIVYSVPRAFLPSLIFFWGSSASDDVCFFGKPSDDFYFSNFRHPFREDLRRFLLFKFQFFFRRLEMISTFLVHPCWKDLIYFPFFKFNYLMPFGKTSDYFFFLKSRHSFWKDLRWFLLFRFKSSFVRRLQNI